MRRVGMVLVMMTVALIVGSGAGRDTVFYQKGVDRLFDCEKKFRV